MRILLFILLWSTQVVASDDTLALSIGKDLSQWQFASAKQKIAALTPTQRSSAHIASVLGQWHFIRGEYQQSIAILSQIADPGPRTKELLSLVQSTQKAIGHHKKVLTPSGLIEFSFAPKDEVLVGPAAEALEKAIGEFQRQFGFQLSVPLRVEFLEKPTDLAKLTTLPESAIQTTSTIGICKYGKIMLVTPRATLYGYKWLDSLIHEYMHYVIASQTLDKTPVWLHEGLARSYQEQWRTNKPTPPSANEQRLLSEAMKTNTLIPFERFSPSIAMLPSRQEASLAYAQVGSLINFFRAQYGDSAMTQTLTHIRNGIATKEAFGKTAGVTWDELFAKWKTSLPLSSNTDSMTETPIVFHQDNVEDARGIQGLPAKAKKYARLAGILRAAGHAHAGAIEYEKALKYAPKSRFIQTKLAMTYSQLGWHQKALSKAASIWTEQSDNGALSTVVGVAAYQQGDLAKSLIALQIALRTTPFDPRVRCTLWKIYETQNESRLAKREQRACSMLQN